MNSLLKLNNFKIPDYLKDGFTSGPIDDVQLVSNDWTFLDEGLGIVKQITPGEFALWNPTFAPPKFQDCYYQPFIEKSRLNHIIAFDDVNDLPIYGAKNISSGAWYQGLPNPLLAKLNYVIKKPKTLIIDCDPSVFTTFQTNNKALMKKHNIFYYTNGSAGAGILTAQIPFYITHCYPKTNRTKVKVEILTGDSDGSTSTIITEKPMGICEENKFIGGDLLYISQFAILDLVALGDVGLTVLTNSKTSGGVSIPDVKFTPVFRTVLANFYINQLKTNDKSFGKIKRIIHIHDVDPRSSMEGYDDLEIAYFKTNSSFKKGLESVRQDFISFINTDVNAKYLDKGISDYKSSLTVDEITKYVKDFFEIKDT